MISLFSFNNLIWRLSFYQVNKKNRKRKEKLVSKNEEVSGQEAHTNTRKLNWNISTITDDFLDQKRVNVCEHTVNTVPDSAVFTVCSHTFTLFWSRKTSVIVEIFQLSICVFVCAFRPVISSFFGKRFSCLFLFFVVSILRYFPFHMVSLSSKLYLKYSNVKIY